jgi:hypothetical protein
MKFEDKLFLFKLWIGSMYICMYVCIAGTPCYESSVQNLLENACREAEIYKDSQVVSYDMSFSHILILYTS